MLKIISEDPGVSLVIFQDISLWNFFCRPAESMKFWLLDHTVILNNNKDLNEGNYCISCGIYNAKAHSEEKSSSGCYPRGSKAAVSLARGEGLRSPGIGSQWPAVYEQEEKWNAAMQKEGDKIIHRDIKVEKAHQSYYHSTEDKNSIAEIVTLMNLA